MRYCESRPVQDMLSGVSSHQAAAGQQSKGPLSIASFQACHGASPRREAYKDKARALLTVPFLSDTSKGLTAGARYSGHELRGA